ISARFDRYGGECIGAYVDPGKTTTVSFRLSPLTGSTTGTETDSESRSPILGALSAIQLNWRGGGILVTRVIADAEGRYIANGLHPGSYIISVTAGSYQNRFAGVEIGPDQTKEQSFELLGSPGAINGVVRDAANSPISGASVMVRVTSANG